MPGLSELAAVTPKDLRVERAALDDLVRATHSSDCVNTERLARIELGARALATHGQPEDRIRLAGVLIFNGVVLGGTQGLGVAEGMIAEGLNLLRQLVEQGDAVAQTQLAELSRRLARGQSLPGEIMLGDVAPTSH